MNSRHGRARKSMMAVLLAIVATLCLPGSAFPQVRPGKGVTIDKDYTRVEGKLVSINEYAVVIDPGDGNNITIPCLPQSKAEPAKRHTSLLVSATCSPECLPGTTVAVRGKFKWSDFYSVEEPSIRLFMDDKPGARELKGDIDLQGEIRFVGIVVNSSPLIVRHVNNGVKFIDGYVNGTPAGRFAISGADFRIQQKDESSIRVYWWNSPRFVRKDDFAIVRIPNNVHPGTYAKGVQFDPRSLPADEIQITRKDPITREDFQLPKTQNKRETKAKKKS